ncbi:hypothetical protein ACHHYP_05420 [Achlya hypogyna]|uniref:Thioredoxin domain-containing protein n=1 Tax=Achlya hypogyna TaxID=1202772 RepID=A0A1V9ZNV7_ACHHY|nr:hypothetical protein ACHHYP_05420 [Achlya hypogyna]
MASYRGFWADLFAPDHDVGQLVDVDDVPVSLGALNQTVLVLFSGYWCPPCRAFTRTVVRFLEEHAGDVSVLYFGRDHNAAMQSFNLRTKPYFKLEWRSANGATLKRLKEIYPSIQGIPTVFAVDRDSGVIYSERARVGLLLHPDSILDLWLAGGDISTEEEEVFWSRDEVKIDAPEEDIVPHLPFETLVNEAGAPTAYDDLNTFILLYINAQWAHFVQDKITPVVSAFAAAHADDVSVVYYSLDANATDADKVLDGTNFYRFAHSANLVETAYELDKILSKDDPYNTFAAPRVIVIEKDTHKIVAKHHYGILIKPTEQIAAWKQGKPGITEGEIDAYFS